MYHVCIVGGGASGMATAIELATNTPELRVIILEKQDKMGKKLLATGNGRCNISNANMDTFGETCKFFRGIGVEIKVLEEGRAYPISEQGKDVVTAMTKRIEAYGIEVKKNCIVTEIRHLDSGEYAVFCGKEIIKAQNVVLATGGKAAPQFGTVGDGYAWAKKMGHSINKLIPALVAIKTDSSLIEKCKGVRAKCKISLFRHQFWIESEEGELQFTKDGLSGIAIFNLSNLIHLNQETKFEDYTISVDFLSRYTFMEIFHIISLRREIIGMKTKDLLLSIVNDKVAEEVIRPFEDQKKAAKDLEDKDLEEIINAFKNVSFKVTGAGGWRDAQCTSGGIPMNEIELKTMESKILKGLYFAGEIIDYDGPCGGFNLENAWFTSRKIGKAICSTE